MKKYIPAIAVVVVCVIAVLIFTATNTSRNIYTHAAIMCSAVGYTTDGECGYLDIVIDDERSTQKQIPVKDAKVAQLLSSSDLSKIIGVNIHFEIPKSAIAEKHLDVKTFNAMNAFMYNTDFDGYCKIVDVSFN